MYQMAETLALSEEELQDLEMKSNVVFLDPRIPMIQKQLGVPIDISLPRVYGFNFTNLLKVRPDYDLSPIYPWVSSCRRRQLNVYVKTENLVDREVFDKLVHIISSNTDIAELKVLLLEDLAQTVQILDKEYTIEELNQLIVQSRLNLRYENYVEEELHNNLCELLDDTIPYEPQELTIKHLQLPTECTNEIQALLQTRFSILFSEYGVNRYVDLSQFYNEMLHWLDYDSPINPEILKALEHTDRSVFFRYVKEVKELEAGYITHSFSLIKAMNEVGLAVSKLREYFDTSLDTSTQSDKAIQGFKEIAVTVCPQTYSEEIYQRHFRLHEELERRFKDLTPIFKKDHGLLTLRAKSELKSVAIRLRDGDETAISEITPYFNTLGVMTDIKSINAYVRFRINQNSKLVVEEFNSSTPRLQEYEKAIAEVKNRIASEGQKPQGTYDFGDFLVKHKDRSEFREKAVELWFNKPDELLCPIDYNEILGEYLVIPSYQPINDLTEIVKLHNMRSRKGIITLKSGVKISKVSNLDNWGSLDGSPILVNYSNSKW